MSAIIVKNTEAGPAGKFVITFELRTSSGSVDIPVAQENQGSADLNEQEGVRRLRAFLVEALALIDQKPELGHAERNYRATPDDRRYPY